ncbi:MAG TPA: HemK/PrmC family methyltransferase [Actinomycetota bacterium]|jgi:release factor glutamine methyltransferase|nr:HemK/PrmC family methyltransferase [Actinomycetota bacterium]
MTTVRALRDEGRDRLARSAAIDQVPPSRPKWDAETLLAHVLGEEEFDDLDPDAVVPSRSRDRFRRLVRRRAGGEPIAHIIGEIEFRGLRLRIRPGAFVPRQSSEFLVEQAVRRLRGRRKPVHVDVATGAGPVALAVAAEVRRAEVYGTDLLATGLRHARANARTLGLGNVHFHTGDLLSSLPRRLRRSVDVLTLHPPYVPKEEIRELPLEIRGFEPAEVLTDFSEQGIGLVERTAEEAWDWLRPGGWILIEVSGDRVRLVKRVLRGTGYGGVESTKGWPFVTRVVVARA